MFVYTDPAMFGPWVRSEESVTLSDEEREAAIVRYRDEMMADQKYAAEVAVWYLRVSDR